MSNFDFGRVTASDQPRNNCECMIDVESLGTVMGSPVVTIGATLFDPYASDSGEELMRRGLLIRIDISDAVNLSDDVEGGTLRWWFEQKDAAIKALVGDDAVSMQAALTKLTRYCNERGSYVNKEFFNDLTDFPRTCRFWAKDPDFDMRLLQFFYEHPNIDAQMPWKFWECRSVRTVQDLAWPDGDRPDFDVKGGVAHDARWDAVTQAMMIQAGMRRLGLARDQDVQYDSWKGND
jgi:hypothetical protein